MPCTISSLIEVHKTYRYRSPAACTKYPLKAGLAPAAATISSAATSRSSVLTPSTAISPSFFNTFQTSSPACRIFSNSEAVFRTIIRQSTASVFPDCPADFLHQRLRRVTPFVKLPHPNPLLSKIIHKLPHLPLHRFPPLSFVIRRLIPPHTQP